MTVLIPLLLFQHLTALDMPTVEKNPYTSKADIEQGKKLYAGRCAGCHGPAGDGGKGTNLATPSLPRGQTDLALYRVIRYGLPETEMPSHNMTQREIWQIAAWVRQLGRAGSDVPAGDARRGEVLAADKGGCLACHLVKDRGGLSGPPLTDVANRRSASWIRTKLLRPEEELTNQYRTARLMTKDGKSIAGVVLNEDTYSIQVRDNGGRLHSFWKADLAGAEVERRTPMPSYANVLSAQEINDIVAYLSSIGGVQ